MERRRVLSILAVGAGALVTALVSVPLVGQVLTPLRRRRAEGEAGWHPVGRLDDFAEGQPERVAVSTTVKDGWAQSTVDQAAWVLRGGDAVTVLSGTCPHLGCSVRLAPTGRSLQCPCHESEFGPDGAYRRGPARRGLDPLPSRVVDGRVEIRWVDYEPWIAERRPVGS